jgi:hypothetical protein
MEFDRIEVVAAPVRVACSAGPADLATAEVDVDGTPVLVARSKV